MADYNSSLTVMKLSERLFILNDRQIGLMTRLHFMKNILNNPELRPSFLPGGDKQFDSGWKLLLRKFPYPEIKTNNSALNSFNNFQKDILPQLSSFYFNLVDILNLNDHISELLPLFSAAQIILDLTTNHDLTKLYLELISNHFALMIFLTRINEIKPIMALFNYYYEQTNGKSEPSFPRMAERFIESLENMIKSLQQEIQPYNRKLFIALNSLDEFFVHRTVRAKNWADGDFLNILADPESMSHTVLSDRLSCELITYETLERWIIFGYILIASELNDEHAFNRFKNAMKNSYVVSLFRDEVIFVHSLISLIFEGPSAPKLGGKKINELKETLNSACSQAPEIHSDRRNYLKLALRNLYLVFADDPGLLGPKAFWAFWGISYATDEINWLLRHVAHPPTKKNTTFNVTTKNLNDKIVGLNLPEILFYIDELKNLVLQHATVIQKFYLKLLKNYDNPGMSEMLRDILPRLDIKEIKIFNGILSQISEETNGTADFSSTRLDWLRLQTFLTSNISPINFNEYRRLFEHVHSTIFHTKLVDYLDELLKQTGNLSNFYFYQKQFRELSIDSCKQPSLMRFSIVFVNICGQLVLACHSMCPEERQLIGRDSVRLAKQLLNNLVENTCNYILIRIDEFGELADQLSPHNAASLLVEQKQMKKKKLSTTTLIKGKINSNSTENNNAMTNKKSIISQNNLPGYESYKRNREEQTNFDKTFYSLTQLCATINHHKELQIFDQIITPREFLQNELQTRLIDILGKYTLLVSTNSNSSNNSEKSDDFIITKPSDLLRRIQALVDVLVGLEQHVCIDVVSLFTTIFGQHTQPRDAFLGELTMTGHYAQWYCEIFLKHAQKDHFVWSPPMKSFMTTVTPDVVCFRAEDYTDFNELKALAQIIGPLGMRFICDQLIQDVGRRLEEMKKIVIQNRQILESLRDKLEQPGKAKQIAANLHNIELFNTLLKEIGVTLALKNLIMQSTYSVVKQRAPYLMDTLKMVEANLVKRFGNILIPRPMHTDPNNSDPHHNHGQMMVTQSDIDNLFGQLNDFLFFSNVSSTMGQPSDLDYTLCGVVNQNATSNAKLAQNTGGQPIDRTGELEYRITSLMVVMIATTFPKIMKTHPSPYRIDLDACSNNMHCVAYAINSILTSMISMLKPGDSERASMEFLALCSSNMLRNCLEQTASSLLLEMNQASSSLISSGNGTNGQSFTTNESSNDRNDNLAGTTNHRSIKYQDTLSLIFDMTLKLNPLLTANLQEIFFPYSLVRCAYHNLVKISKPSPFTASIVNYTTMMNNHNQQPITSSANIGGTQQNLQRA